MASSRSWHGALEDEERGGVPTWSQERAGHSTGRPESCSTSFYGAQTFARISVALLLEMLTRTNSEATPQMAGDESTTRCTACGWRWLVEDCAHVRARAPRSSQRGG